MRGTRYGDFSRFAADPAARYTGVLMQQGRVQLDADWNEQAALREESLRRALADVHGGSWAPAGAPGYELRARHALQFDGRGWLEVEGAGELVPRGRQPRTFELWIAPSGAPGVLLDCAGEDDAATGFRLEAQGGRRLLLGIPSAALGPPIELVADLPAGDREAHVAAVFGAGFAALVVDGRQLARTALSRLSDVRAERLVLGGPCERSTGAGYVGLIGGVRVWEAPRSLEELSADGGSPADLDEDRRPLAAWTFEGTGGASVLSDTVSGRRARLAGDPAPALRLVDLDVLPGRIYVEGQSCELDGRLRYSDQADTARLPASGTYLAYLELWEESVSAVEDPALREVALGGPDTTVRTRIDSRVRLAPTAEERFDDADAALRRALAGEARAAGRMAADHDGEFAPGNYLYRVEIHAGGRLHTGGAGPAPAAQIAIVEIDVAGRVLVLAEEWTGPSGSGFEIVVVALDEAGTVVTRVHTVDAVEAGGGASRLRLATDPSDLEGLQSHSVCHHAPPPTFKWSRRNGADLFAIAPADTSERVAKVLLSAGAAEPLRGGDVVEPLATGSPLAGLAHELLAIERAAEHVGEIELDGPLPAGVAYLRRWDHRAQGATARGRALPVADEWIEIEDGIRVRFEPGDYRRGDYWWIVARTDGATIAWPQQHGHPEPLAPSGVERLRAPLALLSLEPDRIEIVDLRRVVGAVAAGAGAEAPDEPVVEDDVLEPAHPAPPYEPEPPEPPYEPPPPEPPAYEPSPPEPPPPERPPPEPPAYEPPPPQPAYVPPPPPEIEEVEVEYEEEVEVVAHARWHRVRTLDLPHGPLHGAASIGDALVLATSEELFAIAPATGAVKRLAALPKDRQGFTLCVASNVLLLVGGGKAPNRPDGRTYAFEPESGTWVERARLPLRRTNPAVAAARGRVHVAGGRRGGTLRHNVRAVHHVYHPEVDRWERAAPLPTGRAGASAAAVGDHLHVVGGRAGGREGKLLDEHETYDLGQGSWRAEHPLPSARPVVDSVAHAGRHVVLLDELDGHAPQSALAFDPGPGLWEHVPALPHRLETPVMAEHRGRLYVVGTESSGAVALYATTLAPSLHEPGSTGPPR